MSRYHNDFALLHPHRPELLGILRDGALTLPSHTSDDELETYELLAALHDVLPLDAVMLRLAQRWPVKAKKDDDKTVLYVLETQTDGPLPESARWLNLEELGELAYPERDALETLLREDAEPSLVSALRPAWAKRGWLGEVKGWLEQELARLGRAPVGEPEQVRVWSLSAVLRQKTSSKTGSGEVYFKAVIDHFIAEPRITATVAELFPDLAPTVLGLEPERGWTLLEPFRGKELNETQFAAKCEVFRRFSAAQLEALSHKDALLEAGCADRSLDKLKEVVPWLVRESLELGRLTPDEQEKLLAAEPRILDKIDALAACGLPETLLHGDIHFGNIVAEGKDFTIFDWTDACWSHPFFDIALQYSHDRSAESRISLIETYLEPWLECYDEALVRRALTLAEDLSPLFYAQSYEGVIRAHEPGSSGEFSGVVAHDLQKLLEL